MKVWAKTTAMSDAGRVVQFGPYAPKRIQRSRAKGWRMPEGAIYNDR
jgi:hypothetical protein